MHFLGDRRQEQVAFESFIQSEHKKFLSFEYQVHKVGVCQITMICQLGLKRRKLFLILNWRGGRKNGVQVNLLGLLANMSSSVAGIKFSSKHCVLLEYSRGLPSEYLSPRWLFRYWLSFPTNKTLLNPHMKTSSFGFLLCLLASVLIMVCFVGCSRSENKSENEQSPAFTSKRFSVFEQTPEDIAFAKAHGATWISTNLFSPQSTLTVDYEDGLFSEGSILACALWVSDVQRTDGALWLTGLSFSIPGDVEVEITTNMLSSIRNAGGKLSFVRLAFQVKSFKQIEGNSSEDSSDHYLIRGKAISVEPILETKLGQK